MPGNINRLTNNSDRVPNPVRVKICSLRLGAFARDTKNSKLAIPTPHDTYDKPTHWLHHYS